MPNSLLWQYEHLGSSAVVIESVTLSACLRAAVGMVLGNIIERKAPGKKFIEKVFLIIC